MNDFTLRAYNLLLEAFKKRGYSFLPFGEDINSSPKGVLRTKFNQHSTLKNHNSSIVILLQDVDRITLNALATAKIERGLRIHCVNIS